MFDRKYDAAVRELENRCSNEITAAMQDGAAVTGDFRELMRRAWAVVNTSEQFAAEPQPLKLEVSRFIIDDLFQLGPLEAALADPEVTEIMVNAPDKVFVERHGTVQPTNIHFFDIPHIERVITRIAQGDNRRCDQQSPLCDCMLNRKGAPFDGSRVNATWMPISADSPTLTIRKFRNDSLDVDALIKSGSLDANMASLIESLVKARCNVIFSGGTGTGKTTILNVASAYIPETERVITVEDTAELRLRQENWVRHVARPANTEGAGLITIRQLVKNTLRERPDRIVVGECRGAEAFDMLQAMGSGHDGSLTTLHANEPRQALSRLMMLMQQSEEGAHMPVSAIMQVITDAVDFVVQLKRYPDGSRKICEVMEVCGMQGDVPITAPIIKFVQDADAPDGTVQGVFLPTGNRFNERHRLQFANAGVEIDARWFDSGRVW